MILQVRVIPRSSRNCIKNEDGILKAHLTKPALSGLANKQLLELLADYLKVKKYHIRIIRGGKSRQKTIQVDDE